MLTICLIIFLLAVGCSAQRPSSRSKPPPPEIGLQKLECTADPELSKDLVCQFNRTSTGFKLNVALTMLTRNDKFWIQIQQFKMTGNKQYQPVGMRIEVEGCDALTNMDSLLMKVVEYAMPNYKKMLKSIFHPCPYGPERIAFSNITIPFSFYENAMFKGHMKVKSRLFNQGNKTLLELTNYSFNGN